MGYMHIDNLYKNQDILMFKECYALEKIHGTSAHLSWDGNQIHFSAGGESHVNFVNLFDRDFLKKEFENLVHTPILIFGEAYGGKQQGMKHIYGDKLKFVVFDVKIRDYWLSVPDAEDVTKKLGLEFVHYTRIPTDLASLDAARDAFSVQAVRNGVGPDKIMEGVVLRPIIEVIKNSGSRIMCKHKRDEFRETASPRPVIDPEKLKVLEEAKDIANEWVTGERLRHVLDKLPECNDMKHTGIVIKAMIEDVYREGKDEIVESDAVQKEIGKKTAVMFKSLIVEKLKHDNV